MVDPTPLIDDLREFVEQRLYGPINNGPLPSNKVRPDEGEFAITGVNPGQDTASGGTVTSLSVVGYFATHHATDRTPAYLLLKATDLARAVHAWWKQPVPQEEAALKGWDVDPANIFVNTNIKSPGAVAVMTIEVGFTLLLELEVA